MGSRGLAIMMNEERLREIAERVCAATPSPWTVRLTPEGHPALFGGPAEEGRPGSYLCGNRNRQDQSQGHADFTFMAAAREDVPALLAEQLRQSRVLAELDDEVQALEARLIALGGDERRRE